MLLGEERLNQKARNMDQGAIRVMFDKASKMENIISMGIGEPNQDTHLDICRAAAEAMEKGNTHYAPNSGRPELRKAIAEKGLIAANLYDPDSEIIVTNGGMGAYSLLMQVLLEPGDCVLIQDPQYLNFATSIRYNGGVPIGVPTTAEEGFCMTAENIRKCYVPGKTKALIINSPNNPTGEVIPLERLKEIAEIAKELDLLVISDEVYGTLLYEDAVPLSIANLPGMKERTIILSSFSKAYAMTGWRIGYAAGPAGIIDRMTKVQEYFNSCINTPSQLAAAFALQHPEFTEELRESFRERREIALAGMAAIPGMKCGRPKGAFYLFPDIRAFGMDSVTFCNRLLDEAGVVCIPGSAFGESGEGYIRLSYTTVKDKLIEGLERMKQFCAKYYKG